MPLKDIAEFVSKFFRVRQRMGLFIHVRDLVKFITNKGFKVVFSEFVVNYFSKKETKGEKMKNLQNKNALNIVLIALVLVVAACNCGKLQELSKQDSSTPTTSDSPTTSSTTTSSPTTSGKADLTLEKYNKIKTNMTLKEVQDIIGSNGEEMSSSEVGKYKTISMKWEGGDYKYIYGVFQNDKLLSKTQANLK